MTSLGSVFSGTNAPIAKSIGYHLERAGGRLLIMEPVSNEEHHNGNRQLRFKRGHQSSLRAERLGSVVRATASVHWSPWLDDLTLFVSRSSGNLMLRDKFTDLWNEISWNLHDGLV
jgi:hypothetical protein